MLDFIRDIVIGIVVWAMCEIIRVVFIKSRNYAKQPNNELPSHNKTFLVCEYYISLFAMALILILSNKFDINSSIVTVLFFVSAFFNWCAFECMHDITKYLRQKLTDDNSANDNDTSHD